MKAVRTRFAPSPTGLLHVGGIRTALFAWLLARQAGGEFILRLEDTDRNREVTGSAEHLTSSLKTLGLDYDEGPEIGGPYAPYQQSKRLARYKEWAQILLDAGRAYADPYSPDEVQVFREAAQKAKQPFLYRRHRPESAKQPAAAWDGSKPLRFKSEPKSYKWHDAVMGDLATGPEVVDDFILIKSDGYPTYNFAHICDDADMKISHVIRGQEFLASVPNYLNLYEALRLEPPILATMPHILNEQGNKKLGKRDGAKDVLDYMRDGFLVEALINFIASLGWNDGTEQEIFTRQELIDKFSLSRVQKGGARFDENRLLWLNGHWIRSLNIDELYQRSQGYWPANSAKFNDSYKKKVLGLTQERLKYFGEIPKLTSFFFENLPIDLDLIKNNKQLKKFEISELHNLLAKSSGSIKQSDFSAEDLQNRLNDLLSETGQKPGVLFSLIRIATTWSPSSPGLAETMAVLGQDCVIERLENSLTALDN